ncbi:GDP-mannose 4,6-dehydratase [Marinobacter sp. M3C]|uniref:GDP-mannose 4,6-dehydratase n=1 Tax=unclassified Marinobacter TaxID=83889 RepID=UPI00200CA9CC|nr:MULTISPECIES: GDP-mannose 4,6-dehydratase [unclassified Marinobacter]MCL1485664.1 GDP-mannose 4,6-dehydratase [Marinobacter sp.]UQG54424.1 GDP-mannose 4,6-dehydratase [Marinobacter sp. M4C]UQG60176.1 GDP-mannose 4,6-dehydratase [Marinobacter sp. M3C]UQG63231.1 GDP-mannose 4,6-dehydratase [Marinobacter sp. M2C]UQG67509.1 GDP-mannose 4,6-dehydratase [Marinobacter sp. M1C]
MQKRVLVTGSQGFTGHYMVQEMVAKGYRVTGTGSQPEQPGNDFYIQTDLTRSSAVQALVNKVQPNIVIHLAALAFVGHDDANAFYRVNLMGTRNLLEALANTTIQPECVLLASSANVYGNQAEGLLDETTAPAPANDYAVSKLAMEYMAKTFMPRLPIVIARPFNYTGVGQNEQFLIPKIVAHFQRRAPVIELGNLDVSRDFNDVRAVVAAYNGLIEQCPLGQTFNVASGRGHSLGDIIKLCQKLTGHSIDVQVNPAFVRANEVKVLCGDASRLRQAVPGWQPQPLEQTLQWMLA